jgi:hypothetical protein|tara:strand:- start:556 stop:837 length:282 start_codon:yes stop_codon:yes gene_type:complete
MAETPQQKAEEQDDQQHSWLGDIVRVTILLWSMGILTANYLGIFSQAVDPTFPASLLTGTAATYTPALGKLNKKKKEENGVNVDTSNARSGIK